MLKKTYLIAAGGLALVAAPVAAQAAIGPDAAACNSGKPSVLVNVSGLKARTGELRVQLYGGNPGDFLAKGKKLRRIDLPVTKSGPMNVCIAVPKAGNYAIAVRHDVKNNGSDWNDGGGFSRNPKLSITNYKPSHSQVVIPVGNGVEPINVVMNYRKGLSIGPVS